MVFFHLIPWARRHTRLPRGLIAIHSMTRLAAQFDTDDWWDMVLYPKICATHTPISTG